MNIHYHRIINYWIVIFITTKNSVGFCNRCNQQVLLRRKEIDTCLAVILLIFTAGIGLLIYLALYYSKPEDRCIHCGTQITRYPVRSPYTESRPQFEETQFIIQGEQPQEILEPTTKFCPLCGEKIEYGTRFCPNCGNKF